jgi:hypothetical protein
MLGLRTARQILDRDDIRAFSSSFDQFDLRKADGEAVVVRELNDVVRIRRLEQLVDTALQEGFAGPILRDYDWAQLLDTSWSGWTSDLDQLLRDAWLGDYLTDLGVF